MPSRQGRPACQDAITESQTFIRNEYNCLSTSRGTLRIVGSTRGAFEWAGFLILEPIWNRFRKNNIEAEIKCIMEDSKYEINRMKKNIM